MTAFCIDVKIEVTLSLIFGEASLQKCLCMFWLGQGRHCIGCIEWI